MIPQVSIGALVGLTLMLAVVAVYVVLARRFRLLWHPLSIIAAVGVVSVLVSVLGQLLFRGGWAGVLAMLQRSAIGGLGWGLIIALVVWASRRAFTWWTKRAAG
ncbi:MAG TPA: hypothetical protein VEV86_16080 [Vicinamibacterales bacterium]|nr:hypothetical protein [Vicinamibacterales bacterium]